MEVRLFQSEIFDFIKDAKLSLETTLNLNLATGSGLSVTGHTLSTPRNLTRTKSGGGSRYEATKWKEQAKKYEVDLAGAEVDHVWDLGLGGEDHADNLWPIKKDDNRRAGEAMYEQLVWWEPMTGPKPKLQTAVGSLPQGICLVIRDIQKP